MAGHYFVRSQWCLPTWEHYQALAAYAGEHGDELPPDRLGRPWLVHPEAEHLRATFEHLRAEFEHLRAEFEHLRAPFNLESMTTSVIRQGSATKGVNAHGHPCQKPDGLTSRLIETLTRAGDLVFEPFGGSSPVARVVESMPDEIARRWVSSEIDGEHVDRTREMLGSLQRRLI